MTPIDSLFFLSLGIITAFIGAFATNALVRIARELESKNPRVSVEVHIDPTQPTAEHDELLDSAWVLIANAGRGDWSNETLEWCQSASEWRSRYDASRE